MTRPMSPWIRVLLLVNALVMASQAIGLLVPASIPFPVTVSPLNARFIGALYLAGVVGMVISAAGRQAADARILLLDIALVSLVLLAVTLGYWGDFTARRIPLIWLTVYALDPIAAGASFLALRSLGPARPGRHRFSGVFTGASIVFLVVGLLLLLTPGVALALWPWKLTPLLAQVYAPFFLAFALGCWLAAGETRTPAVLPVVASTACLAIGVLVASTLHLDRFVPGLATGAWFAAFGAALVIFGYALFRLSRPMKQPALADSSTDIGP